MPTSSEPRFPDRHLASASSRARTRGAHRLPTRSLVLASLLALGCSSSGALSDDDSGSTRQGPASNGGAIEVSTAPAILEIRELEALRSLGDGQLIAHLTSSPDARVRARAARALGRMPFPEYGTEVTGPLCTALQDDDTTVRAEASFSLGLRADPESAGVLLAYWRDPDSIVRERIICAAAKVHTPPIRTQIVRSMRDPELNVRLAAVRSTATWDTSALDAGDVDRALLELLSTASSGNAEDAREATWNALYALQRRNSESGLGAYLQHATSADARARIFAVRGLSRITPTAGGTQILIAAMSDEDWRVACEAAYGLGESGDASAVQALLDGVDHPSVHVRVRALEALRNYPDQTVEVVQMAWRGSSDLSSSVRSAAMGTLAGLLDPAEAVEMLTEAAGDRDPVVRAGAAAATEKLESFHALPILEKLVRDKNMLVATTAVDALKHHPDPVSRSILHEFLASPDNGLRLSAITALAFEGTAKAGDVGPIAKAIQTAKGDIAPEVAFNGLRCLGEIGGDEARSAILRSLDYPNFFVRRVAREVLSSAFGQPRALSETSAALPEQPVEIIGRELPARTRNPMVNINTSRGTMTFELFAAEAPIHVERFIKLARQDHYNGLTFHRVVPNFVIQGGDYRGDGNGGVGPSGVSQGQEFTPRTYARGALGMPRNDNPDSGGAQIFVTHRETPHLNDRYTVFGQMVSGGSALDLIEVGDVIESVLIAE